MYNSFVKLFKTIVQFNDKAEPDIWSALRKWFKDILIDTCIEYEERQLQEVQKLPEWNAQIIPLIKEETFKPPSTKRIIDELRKLHFPYRMVFNLSVIDEFNYQNISFKMQIPISEVEFNLTKAREELYEKLFQPVSLIRSAYNISYR
jgi:DNA-directed RNA polymerase specialized sigma24 family protein